MKKNIYFKKKLTNLAKEFDKNVENGKFLLVSGNRYPLKCDFINDLHIEFDIPLDVRIYITDFISKWKKKEYTIVNMNEDCRMENSSLVIVLELNEKEQNNRYEIVNVGDYRLYYYYSPKCSDLRVIFYYIKKITPPLFFSCI